MTNDRIEQAAKVIGSVMSRWDLDGRPDVDGGIARYIAQALADASLLATRKEWGTKITNESGREYMSAEGIPEAVARFGAQHHSDTAVMVRHATEWQEVK